jgi:hypothetical protein
MEPAQIIATLLFETLIIFFNTVEPNKAFEDPPELKTAQISVF